jgi:hypothetical protein
MIHPRQFRLGACLLLVACSGQDDGPSNMDVETVPSGGSAGSQSGAGSSSNASPSAGTSSGAPGGAGSSTNLGGSGSAAGGRDQPSAGSSSTGGGAGEAGGAGSASGGQPYVPGPIDFRQWVLQLPTGSGTSPTTIKSAELMVGYEDDYFYLGDDGGQMFMDPKQGVTTSGSTRCRTELREQKVEGGNAAWPSSGTHTMTVEGKVVKLGNGSIAVAQLFNSTDSIPLGELQYTTGNELMLFYEEAKSAGTTYNLNTSVPLDTRYTFSLAMIDGVLIVSINGKQVFTKTPSAGIRDNAFYFKVGNYDQSTSRGTPDTTPYSIVEAYTVNVLHD